MPQGLSKKAPQEKPQKRTIGRRERVDLPELGLLNIPAKTDTGAYSCAIHAEDIKITVVDGQEVLEAMLIGHNWEGFKGEWNRFTKWKKKKVKNSFGFSEERYLIRSIIRLFGRDYTTDFTLSNREKMTYPILLGRKLLRDNNLLVDVTEIDLSQQYLQKQAKSA